MASKVIAKKRKDSQCGHDWVAYIFIVMVCCSLVVGDAFRNSSILNRGGSGVKIGSSSRSREGTGIKLGSGSTSISVGETKRHRDGIKIGDGTRTRDPSTIRVPVTLTPKLDSSSDTQLRTESTPKADEDKIDLTSGISEISVIETEWSSVKAKLNVGLLVPDLMFLKRQFIKAFQEGVGSLRRKKKGRIFTLFDNYDIVMQLVMMKFTPSPIDKLDILKRLDEGETISGIPRSAIYDWNRNPAALEEYCASTSPNDKRRALKQPSVFKYDKELFLWFQEQRRKGTPICGPILKEKALDMLKKHAGDIFSASDGWLSMWREKYGVRPLAICGERMSADTVAAEEYRTTFRDLVSKLELSLQQIYNIVTKPV
ncbi:uncharacterized protein [Periplaneta americana]|uniref:uncharacterized protein n=1 Tax=Periplaneta americana TaxID=6978 RepID=UPI0037E8C055